MSVHDVIKDRLIREVLHFTTNQGLLGILYSGTVKSRARLPEEKKLEYIYRPNAAFRKDTAWLDYVNLSIGRINSQFFDVAAGRWHRDRDVWWCILSFDPVILTHEGVHFTTTNNIYPAARRGTGEAALKALFAQSVHGRYSERIDRPASLSAAFPTCEQAEVLYPGEVSIQFLRRVYVARHEDHDELCGQFAALGLTPLEAAVQPDVFRGALG
jgi:hypothetical protein